MMLKHFSYAAILCEPVKTKTLVYNSLLMNEVKKAHELLDELNGIRSAPEIVSKYNNWNDSSEGAGSEEEWKEWLENLTMTPVHLPRFSNEEEYNDFVEKKHILLTEVFSPIWDRTLGSSRNLLLGKVQMKGCGLALPVQAYRYVNGSGVCSLGLALKAFIYSSLMDSTAPMGSSRSIGVQWAPWGTAEHPLGIYLRELKVPRLIQVGPELTEGELEEIRNELRSLGLNSARELFESFAAQIASMFIIGGRANCSPDNVLINGQFIDEEIWFWPEELGKIRLTFEFECEKGIADWKKGKFTTSTFLLLRNSLHHIHKFAGFIFSPESIPHVTELEEMFYSRVQEVFGDWELRPLWKEGVGLGQKFNSDEFQSYIKKLEKDGWSFEIEKFKDQGMALNFTKSVSASGTLTDKFNRLNRPDFWKIAIKLSKLNPEAASPEETANMIHRMTGAAGFVLPFRFMPGKGTVKNTFTLNDYLSLTFEHWPQVRNKKMDLTVWDGSSEVILQDLNPATKISGDCVPLYFTVQMGNGKSCILPCLKTILSVDKKNS